MLSIPKSSYRHFSEAVSTESQQSLQSVSVALFFLILAVSPPADAQKLVRAKRVIDGDAILLTTGERVQLIGVRTPKIKHGSKPPEPFGEEAREFIKRLVEGKEVRLETDPQADFRDKHSRILAYLFLHDGTSVNAEIIRAGFGTAIRNASPLKYELEFIQLETMAKKHRRGMWANERKGK